MMKNKVSQLPKIWLSLYSFNIYNIQNPKIHASKKENIKCQFMFFNSVSTSRLILALKIAYFEVLVNYKVLDHRVLFP